jgi:hypothetical protein
MTIADIKEKLVCADCIGDYVLTEEVSGTGVIETCSYCNTEEVPCMELDDLASRVDEVYREHHQPGEEYAYFQSGSDKPSYDTCGSSPTEIVERMIEPTYHEIAEDIVAINSHDEQYDVVRDGATAFFDEFYNYAETPIFDQYHSDLWSKFCMTVKHKSRFFNVDAKDLLNEILEDVGELKTVKDALPIREIGPTNGEETIFRGRRADSQSEINKICISPAVRLGPPPKAKTPAGRMNPAVSPVLYGSLDRKTCIAELRAPIGSTVLTGEFKLLKPIRVLDLTALSGAYRLLSLFASDFEEHASHLKFLRRLDSEISKPILPSGEQIEYIPTQAFVEYLASLCDPPFDGLIFSSAQSGNEGKNIVIFPHAIKLQIPDDFSMEVVYSHSQSLWDKDFVLLKGDESDLVGDNYQKFVKYSITPSEFFSDGPIIQFVSDSVRVHTIQAIEYQADTHSLVVYEKSKNAE